MGERRYPVGRVRLYEPGRRYVQRYDGFGQYDVAARLWQAGAIACSRVDPRSLGLGAGVGGGGEVPTGMALTQEELGIVVCRPFLDTTQRIGLEHFEFHGGQWLALDGLGMGQEVRLYQYDGQEGMLTGAVSRFRLPRNPVMCVSLQRTDPGPSHNWAECPPCTEIRLGVGSEHEWSLAFPYGGPAALLRRWNGVWERVANLGRGARLGKLEGYAPGERLLLWIAIWRGKFVVSTDGFAENVWVSPTGSTEVEVGSGRVALWHNAGQWAFSFIPVRMVTATLDSLPIEAGYDTHACSGAIFLEARARAVLADDGTVLTDVAVEDTTDERGDLTVYQRAWRATLTPYVHREEDPPLETAVCAELYAVQIGQEAEVVDTGAQSWEEISEDVERATVLASDDGRLTVCELGMDNAVGQYAGLREYQRCVVETGWMLDDGGAVYEPAVDGYLVEPDPAVRWGPRDEMRAVVVDPLIRLRDEKCDGRAPVFDGWEVKAVFEWVLGRCGLAAAEYDLEDTGTRLSVGDFGRPLWQVEPGRSWWEFLVEVAEFDYRAEIFCDSDGTLRKGCRHCRESRTADSVARHDGTAQGACNSEVRWELYTRAGEAVEAGQGGPILSVERPRRSLHERDFANYVAVCGLAPDGTPVRATALDADSLLNPASEVYVGWRKMVVAALETYTTQAEANRLAEETRRDRARSPEFVRIVTPLEPGMRVGHVVRIHGGETLGIDGMVYRVREVRHSLQRGERELATTETLGRRLE